MMHQDKWNFLPVQVLRTQVFDAQRRQQQSVNGTGMHQRYQLCGFKVLIGDTVEIVLDPYGGKGRIVKRL